MGSEERQIHYGKPETDAFVKKAIILSWLTVIFNIGEGLVSIFFGLEGESVALAGFGVDSFIEVGSAFLVLWRFRSEALGEEGVSLERERIATLGIGALFVLLALAASFGGGYQLLTGNHPDTTLPGLIISAVSLSFMFFLWSAKKKVALALDSATVLKDASCSMACIKLSAILFAGSVIYHFFSYLWWADPVAAICLSLLIGKEGLETVRAAQSPEFSGGCGCDRD